MFTKILRMYPTSLKLRGTSANIKSSLTRKPVLILLEILAVFLLTIFADRLLGIYFDKTLYFKTNAPNMIVHYDTKEFKFDVFTSNQGLRNEEVLSKNDKQIKRIMALGDSFTLGWGVDAEKSWPKVLEKLLGNAGSEVEIINAGAAGADIFIEWEICRDYVKAFKPDEILLGFYSTDDLAQNLVRYTGDEKLFGKEPVINSALNAFWPNFVRFRGGQFIYSKPDFNDKREYFVQDEWKQTAANQIKQNGNLKNVNQHVADDFNNGKIHPTLVIFGQEKPDFWLLVLNNDALAASLRATDTLFSKLAQCTGDIPVTVVFIPSEELIAKNYHQFRQEVGFRVDDGLLAFDFDKHLKPIVENHGFGYISLLSDFRADGCLDCYYPYDSHMTEVGYRRVAEKVFHSIKIE